MLWEINTKPNQFLYLLLPLHPPVLQALRIVTQTIFQMKIQNQKEVNQKERKEHNL